MTDDFAQKYGRWAVIAGASEGVGASLADQLAERGLDLVLIARNEKLLNEVATGVRERHGVEVRPVVQDLTDPDVGDRVAEATDGLEVGLLIYNAGAANRTVEFLDDSFEDSLKQIKLACIGPVALARHFAPAMRERGRGGIVLVGSLACLAGASLLAVYSAVKAFNVNLAEGLWAELRPHGVDVCCTPLGMTYTEALQRMGYAYDPETVMLSEDVAREIIENIGNGPTYPVGERNRTMASMVWTADRRTLVELMSAASSRLRQPSRGRRADARGGASRREAARSGDGRAGARPGRTADQTAVRGDLRVGRALHGPPEFGTTVHLGFRSRHHHGPRVHRRGGGSRAGLLGRLPARHAGHQHADPDPGRRGTAGDRPRPRRTRRIRRADGGLGGDVAQGARRRPERLGRLGGRICGGGVLRSLFWHRAW